MLRWFNFEYNVISLAKALEMEEEFKQMDDDYVTTKDGKRIPYDDDTQE